MVSRQALARTKISVVVDEHSKTGSAENLGDLIAVSTSRLEDQGFLLFLLN